MTSPTTRLANPMTSVYIENPSATWVGSQPSISVRGTLNMLNE